MPSKKKFCSECNGRATFAPDWGIKPTLCSFHGEEVGYISVSGLKCVIERCKKRARFTGPETRKGRKLVRCPDHKHENSTATKYGLCTHIDPETGKKCETYASLGTVGGKKEFCVSHKPPDRNDIVSKDSRICKNPNCITRATFGIKGTKKVLFCKEHRDPEIHVDIAHALCTVSGCEERKDWGPPGEKAIVCQFHKENGHIRTDKTLCIIEGCTSRNIFGDEDEGIAKYCSKHKDKNHVDLSCTKCKALDCKEPALYGFPGYSREYCYKHKNIRMVSKSASLPKEIDKNCAYCCTTIHYNEEFCSGCKTYISLEKTAHLKRKEEEVREMLVENKIEFIYNKRSGESRRMPDFLIKTKKGYLVIEVDEDQHKRKDYSDCEIPRMVQVHNDLWMKDTDFDKPLLFIRFNPDRYKPSERKREIIKNIRLKKLLQVVEEAIACKNEFKNLKGLNVLYLFYDGYKEEHEKVEEINVEKFMCHSRGFGEEKEEKEEKENDDSDIRNPPEHFSFKQKLEWFVKKIGLDKAEKVVKAVFHKK